MPACAQREHVEGADHGANKDATQFIAGTQHEHHIVMVWRDGSKTNQAENCWCQLHTANGEDAASSSARASSGEAAAPCCVTRYAAIWRNALQREGDAQRVARSARREGGEFTSTVPLSVSYPRFRGVGDTQCDRQRVRARRAPSFSHGHGVAICIDFVLSSFVASS